MTSLLIKSGSCHGLSKYVNAGVQSAVVTDADSFKGLTKCLSFLIDQRILEKPVLEATEKKLEKYLRNFLKWKNNVVALELLTAKQIRNSLKVDLADCVHLLWSFRNTGFFSQGFRDYLMFVIQENLSLLNNQRYPRATANPSFCKTLDSFSKGNLEFNFYREFYAKAQSELDLRKHMLGTNDLIDCFHSVVSYGAPSIPFLLSLGAEFEKRSLSVKNFFHLRKFLKVLVLMKSYFKDPLFISDPEWKQHSRALFECFRRVYLQNLTPVFDAQFAFYKKKAFNPKLYLENLSLACFLNTVFQEPQNLAHLIWAAESVVRYHFLFYSFFRAQNEGPPQTPLLASQLESVWEPGERTWTD